MSPLLLLLLLCLQNSCPLNTTTKLTGAASVNDCLVPPGYYVKLAGPDSGELTKCPVNVNGTGYYRSGWVGPLEATGVDGTDACTACGRDILSDYRDIDEIVDPVLLMSKQPVPGRVSSSPSSCCKLVS